MYSDMTQSQHPRCINFLRAPRVPGADPERPDVSTPPGGEKCSKEAVKLCTWGSFSGSLFVSNQLSDFFFHTWPTLRPSLTCLCKLFPRWIPARRPMEYYHHIYGMVLPPLVPQGVFLSMWNVSLATRMENIQPPALLTGFSFTLSLP